MLQSIIFFTLGLLCIGLYILMLSKADKIRNSRYWFPAWLGSLLLAAKGIDFIAMSGFFKLLGGL